MIIFIAPSNIEHHRFNRFFIRNGDIKISYDSIKDIIKISRLAYKDDATFVLNGLRLPDIYILKFLHYRNAKIILLQHNSQVLSYTIKQSMKKFFSDLKKYVPWAMICAYFFLLSLYSRQKLKSVKIKGPICYIYGNGYKKKIDSLIANPSIYFMPEPCMLQYGSTEDLKVVDKHINILFIDEPFETTLGVSSKEIVRQINIENSEERVYVKLHPRSDPEKYNIPSLKHIKIIKYIPSSVGSIYGFKSNLFTFIKNFQKRYIYNLETNKFELAKVESKKDFLEGNYIESVNDELCKLRS